MKTYRREDAVSNFFKSIFNERDELAENLNVIKPMKLSKEQRKAYLEATVCCICDQPLGTKHCREHNHVSGAYRGAEHMDCNINYKHPQTIPVIFHNIKHCDGHPIMTDLGKFQDYSIDRQYYGEIHFLHNKEKKTVPSKFAF